MRHRVSYTCRSWTELWSLWQASFTHCAIRLSYFGFYITHSQVRAFVFVVISFQTYFFYLEFQNKYSAYTQHFNNKDWVRCLTIHTLPVRQVSQETVSFHWHVCGIVLPACCSCWLLPQTTISTELFPLNPDFPNIFWLSVTMFRFKHRPTAASDIPSRRQLNLYFVLSTVTTHASEFVF